MNLRILTGPDDLASVRALVLSMAPPDRAQALLPDALIQSPAIGYKAEAMVIRRVGLDWTAILAGNAPASYAGGDPGTAQALLIGATVLYCCAYLCPMLRQIVPTMEKSEVISTTWGIDWAEMEQSWIKEAQTSLGLLKTARTVPALTLGRPTPAPTDPDAIDPRLRDSVPRFGW